MSTTPRFFVPPAAILGDVVTLPADTSHHAVAVLRLHVGEAITVHDGLGGGYRCRITSAGVRAVAARIEERFAVTSEPRTRITVAQALPKMGDKIEQVLQHGTEVGAAGFVLFPSERSQARVEKDKVEKRLERWRGIVRSAAEQSGRGVIPEVALAGGTGEVARSVGQYPAALTLHESATRPLKEALRVSSVEADARLLLLVGPEGGFWDREVAALAEAGAGAVSLGPRVLRTETAALVALAQILYEREG